MLDAITNACLAITDPLLGWLLYLPRDAVLMILALGTALLLSVVRLFTTNQDLLRRCHQDKARLKVLIREARRARDPEALARYRTTLQHVALTTLAAEGKPLLASLVPLILLGTWAFCRIAYLPVRPGSPVALRLYTPLADIGQWAHLVPPAGLQSETGWIREVQADRLGSEPTTAASSGDVMPAERDARGISASSVAAEIPATSPTPSAEPVPASSGVAEWIVRGEACSHPHEILIRCKGRTIKTELVVDGVHYAHPPQKPYGEDPATEVVEVALAAYNPFGIVPVWSAALLPPWIIGYLVLVIPLALLLKPLLRIR